jgi:hypothetical protein
VDEFAEGPASFAGEHEAEGGYDENLPADLESSEEDWSQAPLPADLERKRADWSNAPVTADAAPTATAPVPRAATAPDASGDSADFESNRRTEPRRIFSACAPIAIPTSPSATSSRSRYRWWTGRCRS